MTTAKRIAATVIVHDKTPEGRALVRESVRDMKQFTPLVDSWLSDPEIAFFLICIDGSVPVKAFSMGAKDEAELYARTLRDVANMMPIDALPTSVLAASTQDLQLKCDLVWEHIVAARLASRGGAH